jgi:hypothetical protein
MVKFCNLSAVAVVGMFPEGIQKEIQKEKVQTEPFELTRLMIREENEHETEKIRVRKHF